LQDIRRTYEEELQYHWYIKLRYWKEEEDYYEEAYKEELLLNNNSVPEMKDIN
jgi:hypothetical protein